VAATPNPKGEDEQELDFRIGGRELSRAGRKGGPVRIFRYYDIVPNARIVLAYDMLIDHTRLSVSFGTIFLERNGDA
jgi:uncharacterized protein YndB with AHSA1/START domain